MDLSESSLTSMAELLRDRDDVTLKPTWLQVTQGRIVRVAPFNWWWVKPGRYWMVLGPFRSRRAAREASTMLPTAAGYARWEDIKTAFGTVPELPHSGA